MFTICALYKFSRLDDFDKMQRPLRNYMDSLNVRGTLLLAREGINGTISGSDSAINKILDYLNADKRLSDLEYKFSYSETVPFKRLKVKLKKEIVTLGIADVDPTYSVGTYVKARDWNELIIDPEVVLIDTRNNYEFEIGSFKGSINPNTEKFRQFPSYTKTNLEQYRNKKIAMFCTGGIRCEKSTAYLKEQGFDEVYHLEGGILKYLEEVPEEGTMWQGECFVFDSRVTVNHQLEKGEYDQCHACRLPITKEEQTSDKYLEGISCPHCFDKHTLDQRQRYEERQRQMELSKERGEAHIGADAVDTIAQRRQAKEQKKQVQRDKELLASSINSQQ